MDAGLTYTTVGASQGFVLAADGGLNDVHHTYLAPNPPKPRGAEERTGHVHGINPYEDAAAVPMDSPGFNSLRGVIEVLIITMILLSMLISIGRPDFNLVVYLIGYYIWCVHARRMPIDINRPDLIEKYPKTSRIHVASKTTVRAVNHFNILTICILGFDAIYLFLGWELYVCNAVVGGGKIDSAKCVIDVTPLQYSTIYMQRASILLSAINVALKCVVVTFTFLWVAQQKRHAKSVGFSYKGLYEGTSYK